MKPETIQRLNDWNNENKSKPTSFPFIYILTLIFVVAKLMGHFNYSWWIVFSPLWVPASLAVGIFIIVFIVGIIAALLDY